MPLGQGECSKEERTEDVGGDVRDLFGKFFEGHGGL